jgi:hypothetical protein
MAKVMDEFIRQQESLTKREYIKINFSHLNFVEICSCQWNRMKKADRELREFCKQLIPVPKRFPLNHLGLLAAVESGDFFGLLEVQISVPEAMVERYQVFPPFFCHYDISLDMLSEKMQSVGRKNGKRNPGGRLVSALEADRFVVISPLLQFYLQRGFVVHRIYQAIQFTPRNAFLRFGEEIHKLRCAAASDPDLKIKAETIKLAGNSCYGKTCERKERHSQVSYVGIDALPESLQSKRFKSFSLLSKEVTEVQEHSKSIKEDTPRTIGAFILDHAKLQVLRFAYMLLDFCIDRD